MMNRSVIVPTRNRVFFQWVNMLMYAETLSTEVSESSDVRMGIHGSAKPHRTQDLPGE